MQVALVERIEAQLLVAETQVGEVLVGPGIEVVVLVAPADLAAELDLGGIALHVVVAGQVQADIFLGVLGVLLLPVHLVEAEVGRVIKACADDRPGLFGVVETAVANARAALEGGPGDASRVVFAGLAVTGLPAEGPQAHGAFAAEYVGLDFLGFFALLELALGLGFTHLVFGLGVGEFKGGGVAGFVVLKAAVQGAQVQTGVVVGLVIKVEAATGTLAADLVNTLFKAVQTGAIGEIPVAAGFDVVGAKVALVPAQGCGHTEVVDTVTQAETVADGARHLGAGLVAVLVVSGLGAAGEKQAVMVEGREALYVYRATQGVGVHIRGQGLDHRQRLHQLRGQDIQGHGAAGAFRGRYQGAVDGHAVEVRAQAAHADKAAFALIALNADTGQALYRLGHVGVGQLRHAIGMHHAFDGVRVALLLECLVQADGLTDYLDVFSGTDGRCFGGAQTFAGDCQGQCTDRKADPLRLAATLVHVGAPPKSHVRPGKWPDNLGAKARVGG